MQTTLTLGDAGFLELGHLAANNERHYIKNTYKKPNKQKQHKKKQSGETALGLKSLPPDTQYHTILFMKFLGLYYTCWYTSAWTFPSDNQYPGLVSVIWRDMPIQTCLGR